ncbi:MAG: DNA-binding response regulator [Candidatus Glassbacteria bacterium RIFCSPLOWO2_12_FULL_58_11]|uniref:DNA-binding response regulator n=2 Tax=Candidatus Glassiibacteriota TaxID=1817805 RepID=A0A1F5YV94_9BACT|nr:MAG: DNA-binding response regulator [Candidatus Glassbacteria bacterium GWA2_58_10]OGG04089.1 MAG: DNA-binding response regulator [Candidatus Glassbacteria bacterium RIFCSPLOWO2_12_FULL_58_11]
MIKLLIADDHPIVRRGLMDILAESSNITVIDEASEGKEVLEKVRTKVYDVVVLDIDMPGLSGMDILKILKAEKPGLPVLILSRYPEEQFAVRVIKAGADGFLTKGRPPEELINAIIKVARGGQYISPSLAEKLAMYLKETSEKRPHEMLSNREFQVMLNLGRGKTVQQMAAEMSLSVTTISTYRSRVLKKMKMDNNAQIIYYVINEGLSD